MFFPKKMVKAQITIPKESLNKEIKTIGKSGLLHIDKSHNNLFFANLQGRAHLLHQTVEKHLDTLKINDRIFLDKNLGSFEDEIEKSEETIQEISLKTEKLSNEKDRVEKMLKELREAEKTERDLKEINIESLLALEMYGLTIVSIPQRFFELFQLSIKNYPVFTVHTPHYERLFQRRCFLR